MRFCNTGKSFGVIVILAVCVVCGPAGAEDWPSYRHDMSRSGVTGESLQLPLEGQWVYKARHAPAAAWPDPAQQNYWHRLSNIQPEMVYDRVFHVTSVGGNVYFGSSADDKVYCLDVVTGEEKWSYFTEGPVRCAPSVSDGKVYVGSDDGNVYCLSAADGRFLWKYGAVDEDRQIPGNGRMISTWPVRTSVVVDGGEAYFTAGIFPVQGVYLCCLDAGTGSVKWKKQINDATQGYMLASADRLYVPTGRTVPVMYDRSNGKNLGSINSVGGTFALIADDILVSGPGRADGAITVSDARSKENIATFSGRSMVISGGRAYLQDLTKISAIDRNRYIELAKKSKKLKGQEGRIGKQLKREKTEELQEKLRQVKTLIAETQGKMSECFLWEVALEYPYSMILAGDTIFAGGDGKVVGLDVKDGKEVWRSVVDGRAYGLAVANGKLFVSTNKGSIYCFVAKSGRSEGPRIIGNEAVMRMYREGKTTAVYADAARRIVKETGITKGYCLDIGCGEGRLAYEIAKLTELKIVGVEPDAKRAAAARAALDKAGLYGSRVVVHTGPVDKLPYSDYLFNLIVSDAVVAGGAIPTGADEVYRVLRPFGGRVYLGHATGTKSKIDEDGLKAWSKPAADIEWKIVKEEKPRWKRSKGLWITAERGQVPGSGQWTHQYGNAENTACSMDQMVKGKMAIQWFGEPGPRDMIDRHHRNVLPLFKDGRLFAPGDEIVYAVDAYNGTPLWDIRVANSRRLGVFLDCGSMVLDDKRLYVAAEDKCHGFDVKTGVESLTHTMPQLIDGQQRHWGYIAYAGDMLFGSGRKKESTYTETSYETDSVLWYLNMKLVTSDYLFGMDRESGDVKWTYKDGLIGNTTLTAAEGKLFFIETTSPDAMSDELGRMTLKKMFGGGKQRLVALDAKSGDVIYKKDVDVSQFTEVVYLNYAKGVLIFSGSKKVGNKLDYNFYAINAADGEPIWHKSHPTNLPANGGHGEQNRHPTIVDDLVYAWPYAYKLKTGDKIEGWRFNRHGHGCGGISASAYSLFWRGGNPWMWDLRPDGGPAPLNRVTRPGCWINVIPAGGLALIPESSSGCTCGFPLQTSMAFISVEN